MRRLKKWDLIALLCLVILFAVLYSFIGWQKHVHFQTFGWDSAVFDQELYFVKDFRAPYSSLVKMNGLGDHFQLVFLIFGGIFYKIWTNPLMLFILQSSFASFSAVPLFLLTKKILKKTKLSLNAIAVLSLTLCFTYLFSVSFQAMMFDEFHNEPLVTLPIILMFYALEENFNLFFWGSFIAVLLTKEIFGLLGVPLGLYIWITKKDIKKALLSVLLGLATFYLLIFQVMPSIAGKSTYQHFTYGNSPEYLAQKFIHNPLLFITELGYTHSKQETIATGLLSFGFLPILSPSNLLLPTASLAIRFYDDTTPRLYEFNNHYAAPFIPLLAIASSYGLYRLILLTEKNRRLKIGWVSIVCFLVISTLFQDLWLHGPINSVLKPQFYKTQNWEMDDNDLISIVPKNAVIATQNSLLPHLSERDNFYLLPEINNAEYIAVDLENGPNKFAPLEYKDFSSLITNLIVENKFRVIWQKNKAMLLKRV